MIRYVKELEVIAKYDVTVVGSGPAGICAAVAAARCGLKVAIIERYGAVGGNLTIGTVGPLMGSVGKGTMRDELGGMLRVAHNNMQATNGHVHDMQHAKRLLLEFLLDAGVSLYIQTTVVDVVKDGNALTGLVVSRRDGMGVIESKQFIDASGDGDVAAFSGAPWEMGRTKDGLTQPVTLMYVLTGVDDSRALCCYGEEDNVQFNGERFLDFTARCCEQGILPKNCSSVRLYPTVNPGERLVNTTQCNYINPLCTEDLVKAEVVLRQQIDEITSFLRQYVPGYENCTVKFSADTMGIRESRRIMGEYVLNVDDLRMGRRFEDVIVHKANFTVDIHNPDGGGQAEGLAEVVKAYDIPYRCLVPLNVENLLVTGRCISATHEAMASFRIMSVCMALGEAAGIAAAIAAAQDVTPRTLDVKLVQNALTAKGADLFG